MATTHGNKKYLQILLDPNRAELVMQLAQENGVRPTDMVRQMVYAHLDRVLPSSVYGEAEAKDKLCWRESVRKRIEGRSQKRKERMADQVIADVQNSDKG